MMLNTVTLNSALTAVETYMGIVERVPPDLSVPVNGPATIKVDVVPREEPERRSEIKK